MPRPLAITDPTTGRMQSPAIERAASERLAARRYDNEETGTSRRDLLLFVHALVKCLDRTNNYKLRLQTKALVVECVKRNRMGDPNFSPLQESLALRLRGLVGPVYWRQAQDFVRSYQVSKAVAGRVRSSSSRSTAI